MLIKTTNIKTLNSVYKDITIQSELPYNRNYSRLYQLIWNLTQYEGEWQIKLYLQKLVWWVTIWNTQANGVKTSALKNTSIETEF